MIDAFLFLGAFLCGLPVGMFFGILGCFWYAEYQHQRDLARCG